LQSKLTERTDFVTAIKNKPIAILEAIEKHSMSYMENKYEPAIVIDAMLNLVQLRQCDNEDLTDYTTRFRSSKSVFKSHVGTKIRFTKLAEADPMWDDTNNVIMLQCYDRAYSQAMALLYLKNANQTKYGSVLRGLADQFALGQKQYPPTLTATVGVLNDQQFDANYVAAWQNKKEREKSDKDWQTKTNSEEGIAIPLELTFTQIEGTCFCCGKKGHKSTECKQQSKIARTNWAINKTKATALNQHLTTEAPAAAPAAAPQPIVAAMATSWTTDGNQQIWLDGVQCNDEPIHCKHEGMGSPGYWFYCQCVLQRQAHQKHLTSVRDAPGPYQCWHVQSKQKADLPWHNIKVWYDPNSIANVLSFALMAE
jgi:hypothetical protein